MFIPLVLGAALAAWIMLKPRSWGLYFPFWYALFPKGFLLLDIPGVPVVTMYRMICLVLLIAVLSHGVRSPVKWARAAPLALPMFAVFIAGMLSAIIYAGSDNSGFLIAINFLIEIIVPVYTFSHYFGQCSGPQQQALLRNLLLFYGAIALYGTVAYFLEFNPYIDFLESTSHTGRVITRTYEGTLRGLRAQGTISHPITFGCALVLVLACVASVASAGKKLGKSPFSGMLPLLSIMTILIVTVLTRSRTPLVQLAVIALVTLLASRFSRSWKYIAVGGMALCLLFVAAPSFQNTIFSIINIFDSSVGEAQHGSSLEMRAGQLDVSLRYFSQSLVTVLFGNGLSTTRDIIASGTVPELYNAESLLFTLLINQGLLGIIVYFWIFVYATAIPVLEVKDRNSFAVIIGVVMGYFVFVISTDIQETLSIFLALYSAMIIRWRTYSQESTQL